MTTDCLTNAIFQRIFFYNSSSCYLHVECYVFVFTLFSVETTQFRHCKQREKLVSAFLVCKMPCETMTKYYLASVVEALQILLYTPHTSKKMVYTQMFVAQPLFPLWPGAKNLMKAGATTLRHYTFQLNTRLRP